MWTPANVSLVRVGVNMGDHAQDIENAITVSDETTVSELVEKLLMQNRTRYEDGEGLVTKRVPSPDDYIVIRVQRTLDE